MATNLRVELIHDPLQHRLMLGSSCDPILLVATAEQLVAEADKRARDFEGIDDLHAEQERSEVERLRALLQLVMPEGLSP